MIDRIDEALDGGLPESLLTTGERARLARTKDTIAEVADTLRSVPAPDLAERVMAAVSTPAEVRHGPSRSALLDWLWRPRPIAFRPAYGVGLLAILALAPFGLQRVAGVGPSDAGLENTATLAAAPVRVFVQFRFEAPGATNVALAGSFTEWAPEIRLEETMPGVWSALVPLEPGVHDYTFVVNGQDWVADPAAPQVDDGFGGTNSRLFLTTPAGNV